MTVKPFSLLAHFLAQFACGMTSFQLQMEAVPNFVRPAIMANVLL